VTEFTVFVAVGVEYKPPLPVVKQHTWQRMSAGCITKIIITYKKVTKQQM